jgi:hypothetical protein
MMRGAGSRVIVPGRPIASQLYNAKEPLSLSEGSNDRMRCNISAALIVQPPGPSFSVRRSVAGDTSHAHTVTAETMREEHRAAHTRRLLDVIENARSVRHQGMAMLRLARCVLTDPDAQQRRKAAPTTKPGQVQSAYNTPGIMALLAALNRYTSPVHDHASHGAGAGLS